MQVCMSVATSDDHVAECLWQYIAHTASDHFATLHRFPRHRKLLHLATTNTPPQNLQLLPLNKNTNGKENRRRPKNLCPPTPGPIHISKAVLKGFVTYNTLSLAPKRNMLVTRALHFKAAQFQGIFGTLLPNEPPGQNSFPYVT
uniref:Uncharacterized protein n=1 Tax=Eutreptiella gymnastica TaxID=73025 RepID=A0A7S1I6L2_9EUGL|mmetsp:Transcript_133862/g.232280  ORF Transcript_133862/g.232280 Transcript_133862/m.232280 type:complete len:144 (+) Transcript_133862:299-730(+)